MKLPTVTVKGGPKGTRIINATDYDPANHVLVDPADAAMLTALGISVGTADDGNDPVDIPADWAGLHHTKIQALAKSINGGAFEAAEGQSKTEAAVAIVEAEVAERLSLVE